MSYDIYGELLRSGHCEVHPHVHESYPCSICIADNKERQRQRDQEQDYYSQMEREYWESVEATMRLYNDPEVPEWARNEWQQRV